MSSQRERDLIISGALAVLFFLGYYLSLIFGPHSTFTIGIFIGLGGLVLGLLLARSHATSALPSWRANPYLFALVTIAFYLIAKYSSLLLHEWSHSTVAYLLGVMKTSPLDIYYGSDWTMRGISAIDDPVVYPHLMATGNNTAAGMTAIAGPLMNVILATLALALLFLPRVRRASLVFFLAFWFALTNIAQVGRISPSDRSSTTAEICITSRPRSTSLHGW